MGIKIKRTVVGKVECDGCGTEREYDAERETNFEDISNVTTGLMEKLVYQYFKGRYGWTLTKDTELLCPECVELRKKQEFCRTISTKVHKDICPQCDLPLVAPIQMYTNVEQYGSKSFVMECRYCKTKLRVSFRRCVYMTDITIVSKDTEITWKT